jgi:hypothetical protein
MLTYREVPDTTHLCNKDGVLHNVGCAALACVDDIMTLRHGALLAAVLRLVDAKLHRIACVCVLDQIRACHGGQTERRCAEKWSQAFCPARSVTYKRGKISSEQHDKDSGSGVSGYCLWGRPGSVVRTGLHAPSSSGHLRTRIHWHTHRHARRVSHVNVSSTGPRDTYSSSSLIFLSLITFLPAASCTRTNSRRTMTSWQGGRSVNLIWIVRDVRTS